MSSWTDSIGGYFELELPKKNLKWLAEAHGFNSARSAFSSLVSQLDVKEIWLPRYICNTMIDVLVDQDVNVKFYDIDDEFDIKTKINLKSRSLLLYINYFGFCDDKAKKIIDQYGKDSIVIDNSQAFFCKPFDALANIYSPRKFFGLPDGGLLYSKNTSVRAPSQRDNSSGFRMSHLISRLTNSPEEAYQKYLEAEKSISRLPVLGMSQLTERLLQSLNFSHAKSSRQHNAEYLHKFLGKYNKLKLDFKPAVSPLCYPFIPDVKTRTREELISKKVFLPSYWPEVMGRAEKGSFEWNLASKGLFLPCDQRYNENDMDRLINLLMPNGKV